METVGESLKDMDFNLYQGLRERGKTSLNEMGRRKGEET